MKKKTIALVLACVICVGIGIGGTLAWLTATTDDVTNTFTTSDINITLAETKTDFKMVPGCTIEKDPKVTVLKDSEKCYLFVKLQKSSNFDSFMTYTVADGWTQLTGVPGVNNVYYRVVDADTANDQSFYVIKDNTVTVSGDVTKANMNALTAATYPTLTVTAYASQYYQTNDTPFDVATAWANAQPSSGSSEPTP